MYYNKQKTMMKRSKYIDTSQRECGAERHLVRYAEGSFGVASLKVIEI
jgi:hypothetical protein